MLKSGTNPHPPARSTKTSLQQLRRQNFFNNKNGLALPVTHYNQYGGTVGGPLYIPKVFDGRDKVFWFFAFEGMKLSQPGTAFMSVPTDAERQGDFSKLLSVGTVIYNPYSAVMNGTVINRTAFPQNKIPSNLLNPVAQNYLQYFPRPNLTSVRADDFENYGTNNITTDNFSNEFGRIDLNLTQRLRTYFNIRHTDYAQSKDDWYDNIATGSNLSRSNWGGSLDNVFMMNATNILNLRLNFTRMFEDHSSPSHGFDPTSLGMPAYMAANSPYLQMPDVTFATAQSGYRTLGQTGANTLPSQSLQAFGTWSAIRGAHQLKIGGDVRQYRLNIINYGRSAGEIAFTGNNWVRFGKQRLHRRRQGSGHGVLRARPAHRRLLRAELLGDVLPVLRRGVHPGRLARGPQLLHQRRSPHSTPRLPLARQRAGPAPTMVSRTPRRSALTRRDRRVQGGAIAASAARPVQGARRPYLRECGDTSVFKTSNMWSTRAGFAWTPDLFKGKTVMRGGFGIFATPLTIATLQPTGAYSDQLHSRRRPASVRPPRSPARTTTT